MRKADLKSETLKQSFRWGMREETTFLGETGQLWVNYTAKLPEEIGDYVLSSVQVQL